MLVKGIEVKIIKGDIKSINVDAVVNAGLNALKRERGKYFINVEIMKSSAKTDEFKIREATERALRIADRMKIHSIAFPALGCAEAGVSWAASAKIMSQEVFRFSRERSKKSLLNKVIFCLYDDKSRRVFDKNIVQYLTYMLHKLQQGPFSTVDIIIEMKNNGLVVIERSNPPFGWALPGGFVDYNESLENAAAREAKEETGLDVYNLRQFHTYSRPDRDPRFHTIATVFTAKARGMLKAASDAKDIKVISKKDVKRLTFTFDHKKILEDYLQKRWE